MKHFAEISLEEAIPMTNQDSGMGVREDLKKIRCAVVFCLLSVLVLALPTAYLLIGNLTAHKPGPAQVAEESTARFLKQQTSLAHFESSTEKPRAHLTVKKQDPSPPVGNQLPVLQWEHERGLAFTKNNMNYTNKSLVIPKAGDYYIYSQVTFRGHTPIDNKPASVTQVITKVTDSYPEPTQLLTATKTLCNMGNNWFQPIYLGAVIFMEEGDRLMVNVSDIQLVDYTKEHKTFFGAFLL
uniref:Tumor necrosis factor ligand superfamily member 15 n=1 Tax=Pelodiscus sinensis TaxID=13735 RepID=K7GEX5_PELSI|nr:tumor necrosis factor ligand superfamily member 15 [Pelodiscus sinensis]|eukprot:XP_006137247.1 tumor necrosis factor ligand superfamily member 15 [Pelodiscus sinensis]